MAGVGRLNYSFCSGLSYKYKCYRTYNTSKGQHSSVQLWKVLLLLTNEFSQFDTDMNLMNSTTNKMPFKLQVKFSVEANAAEA